jgi:hypothetical protein
MTGAVGFGDGRDSEISGVSPRLIVRNFNDDNRVERQWATGVMFRGVSDRVREHARNPPLRRGRVHATGLRGLGREKSFSRAFYVLEIAEA